MLTYMVNKYIYTINCQFGLYITVPTDMKLIIHLLVLNELTTTNYKLLWLN